MKRKIAGLGGFTSHANMLPDRYSFPVVTDDSFLTIYPYCRNSIIILHKFAPVVLAGIFSWAHMLQFCILIQPYCMVHSIYMSISLGFLFLLSIKRSDQ